MNLRCPHCGDTFTAELEYTPYAHSEHRDHTGYACDNWECGAEWNNQGGPTKPSKLTTETP